MKADLHVHSSYSEDGRLDPKELLSLLKAKGILAVAITDHNSVQGSIRALKEAKDIGILVVRGTEISSTAGHIGALGIDQDVPKGLSPEETIEGIHALGGIAVAVHPFRFNTGIGGDTVRRCKFDAIEVLNGWTTKQRNAKAQKIANELKLGFTAGSDGHKRTDIGKAYVNLEDCNTEDQVLDSILNKKAIPEGESMDPGELVIDAVEMTIDWMRRGFKRL